MKKGSLDRHEREMIENILYGISAQVKFLDLPELHAAATEFAIEKLREAAWALHCAVDTIRSGDFWK